MMLLIDIIWCNKFCNGRAKYGAFKDVENKNDKSKYLFISLFISVYFLKRDNVNPSFVLITILKNLILRNISEIYLKKINKKLFE